MILRMRNTRNIVRLIITTLTRSIRLLITPHQLYRLLKKTKPQPLPHYITPLILVVVIRMRHLIQTLILTSQWNTKILIIMVLAITIILRVRYTLPQLLKKRITHRKKSNNVTKEELNIITLTLEIYTNKILTHQPPTTLLSLPFTHT